MGKQKISYDDIRQVKLAHPELTCSKIVKHFGADRTSKSAVVRALKGMHVPKPDEDAVPPGKRKIDHRHHDENNEEITTRSCDIRTVEQAVEFHKVDLDIWMLADGTRVSHNEVTMRTREHTVETVERDDDGRKVGSDKLKTHGATTFTNYVVRLVLKRKVPKPAQDFLVEFLGRFDGKKPPAIKPVKYHTIQDSDDCVMVEWDVLDPHMGMLAWAKETGQDWDVNIAYDVIVRATQDIIDRTGNLVVEKVLFPIGNDWLHLDNALMETPKGTPLQADGRFPKIVVRAQEAAIAVVDLWRQVAPVHIPWIPGNHDYSSSFMMARILDAWFRNDPHVTVDCSPAPHKCVTYGPAAIAFTHGHMPKSRDISAVMMSTFREEFGRCKHFEVHTGHNHKLSATRLVAADTLDGGIIYRQIASLAPSDDWHVKSGFHPRPTMAEAFVWHKKSGLYAHHFVQAQWENR